MRSNNVRLGVAGAAIKALATSLVVAGTGSLAWGALLVANLKTTPAVPWAAGAMVVVLVVYVAYLSGWGPPLRMSGRRRSLLRARRVAPRVFVWAGLAGLLALLALVGLWVVLVELTGAGGNPTIAVAAGYPAVTVGAAIAVGSLVSPVTEEAAFRGYAQVLLEERMPGLAAVIGSSILFALYHAPTQGLAWSKLLFFFLVGVVFGTIALYTRSTLPALPVHIIGDLIFFTMVWPFDASRHLIADGGPDVVFWMSMAAFGLFAFLSALAFWQLRREVRRNVPSASYDAEPRKRKPLAASGGWS